MRAKPVKQETLVRISLLLALLVSLPRNFYLYKTISVENLDFSGIWLVDFMFRIAFLFGFSWAILYLNANLAYTRITAPPARRYSALIVLDIGLLILTLALWEWLHSFLLENELTREDIGFVRFRYAILLLVLFFIARILRLQRDQQASLLINEKLKRENLKNELASLKTQVNPHFLFNSLNTLAALVRDNEQATNFVAKLSRMYRYILQSGESDLVTLEEEIKFLQNYIYLIQTRYRERFQVDLEIDPDLYSATIPPLALQLLVENAVKHNEISETHPLRVHIYSEGDTLFVENKIHQRTSMPEQTGFGLANLQKRFAIIKKADIGISRTNDTFRVALPLKTRNT
jgi:sensor histidine kinase YesM